MTNKKNLDNHHDDNDAQTEIHPELRRHNKTMILIKSSVFALFIVLVTMAAAFMIVKHRRDSAPPEEKIVQKCERVKHFKLSDEIVFAKEEDGILIVLTKVNDDKQEVIRFDAKCGKELNRFVFQVD